MSTLYPEIKPTDGDVAATYEWSLDIDTGDAETPSWVNIPDITALNPTPTSKLKDITTYAHKGRTAQTKIGEDFTATVNILGIKDDTGEFQPELVALIAAADAQGKDNLIPIRYYHATSAALAYQTTVSVQWARVNTGNDDEEFFGFTFTGQGDREPIGNPNLDIEP